MAQLFTKSEKVRGLIAARARLRASFELHESSSSAGLPSCRRTWIDIATQRAKTLTTWRQEARNEINDDVGERRGSRCQSRALRVRGFPIVLRPLGGLLDTGIAQGHEIRAPNVPGALNTQCPGKVLNFRAPSVQASGTRTGRDRAPGARIIGTSLSSVCTEFATPPMATPARASYTCTYLALAYLL